MKDTKNEMAYIRRMLMFLDTHPLVSIVGDSYDIFNFVEILGSMKTEIAEKCGTDKFVVIRPDSGDPTEVCLRLVITLADRFGTTINEKGFKVLNHVRIIQGDGVNQESIQSILDAFIDNGFSADNIAFGMGGALLQQVNRDTQKFAMKCSAIKVNGEWRNVRKEPVTDSGKLSKAGRVTLYQKRDGIFHSGIEDWEPSALVPVFENGKLLNEITFEEVRKNSNK